MNQKTTGATLCALAVPTANFLAFCALAVPTAGLAADSSPNPALVTRFLDAGSDVTVPGVVNDGTIYKRGAGTATLTAPALGGGSSLKVAEGDVVLDLDATPSVPELPAYLQEKVKLWLDPEVNIVTDGSLVTKWFDRREADTSAATPVYPYATSEVHYNTVSDAGDRKPSLVTGQSVPNGNYVDFGAYGASTCKGLSVDNTGVASGLIYARDVFAVFARRPGMAQEGFTIFSHNSAAYWAGGPVNNCLFASTPNTRADKGATRIDRSPAWGGRVKIKDNAWHLLSSRLPGIDAETGMNQIGFDRSLTAYSGGFLLAEVLVFDQRLSDFDRMRVEDYLWKKWMGARQTAVGDVAVAAGSTVTLASSSDVTATLSGGGSFAKSGTGIATLLDGGFGGAVELLSGSVRNEAIPFAVAEAGQTLAAGGQGIVTRTAADAGVFAKAGSGQLVAASLPQATEVRVTGGNLVLSPPSPSADFLAPADFPNAGFEDFGVPVSQNVGGGAGTATPQTYGNWTFDRAGRSGGALLMILNKTAQSSGTAGNTYNIFADDARGIGYEGTNYLYLCRGDATGTFTIPASGMYRLSFNVGARDKTTFILRPIRLKIDGSTIQDITSFNALSWMRYEVALPFLAAGEHTVTFSDELDQNSSKIILFDDIKVTPAEARDAAPVSVAIANPGFDEPLSNVSNYNTTFAPVSANCTGWTVPADSSWGFAGGSIRRRWFDDVADYGNGLCANPDEMPDGFLCAQIFGNRAFSQTVSLPSAGRYRLTFHLAKRNGLSAQLVTATVGSQTVKKVWVRHDDWRKYEAVFDVEAGGSALLSFAGSVTDTSARGDQPVMNGGALLDGIALERLSDMPAGELVENGGFESGAASWTFSGGAATASANSLWIENVTNTPPQGADCAVIGGRGAASGAVAQDVAFPAAGRYELKFRIRRFRENPFTEDTKVSVFRAAVGGETIHMSYVQRNEDERVVTIPFAVAEAGTKTLKFDASFQESGRAMVMLDDVSVIAAPAEDRTDLAQFIPPETVLAVSSGATLRLDFDGTAKVAEIRYGGRRVYGDISHETFPAWVSGRGALRAEPPATIMVVR